MNKRAFTIVELLVVIVVIGILAAITIVSYTGLSSKANVSSLQSDLSSAKKQLGLYYVDHGYYPTSINTSVDNCPSPADTKYCLKPSGTNQFNYSINPAGSTSPQAFRLTSTKNSTVYSVTNNTQPAIATTTSSCPTGYIPVPGSGTYGTNDFCVMKYEAKNVGGVATSQAASMPWSSVNQPTAISTAAAACTGCHLITEAEWMTIAQNVLSVGTNWSSGTVGSGCIYRGNVGTADSCGYNAITDPESGTGRDSKASLNLTNAETIWDFAGNVSEWTSSTTTIQPGTVGGSSAWRQWNTIANANILSPNPAPSSTGILGASSWSGGNGIGYIYNNADVTATRGFIRGGAWDYGVLAGVLSLNLVDSDLINTHINNGFRVSR
jgi:prepilin-type N-terminal cleavage/methylation domain-containing protein